VAIGAELLQGLMELRPVLSAGMPGTIAGPPQEAARRCNCVDIISAPRPRLKLERIPDASAAGVADRHDAVFNRDARAG
jgi:hypothetical protein